MKIFLIGMLLLSVWAIPSYQEEIDAVEVVIWSNGQVVGGSAFGTEAVFQLPGRMLKVEVQGCEVVVNNQVVTLDRTGFVDTNPDGSNPTFLDTRDRLICQDGGSFVVRPYFQE